MYIRIIAWLLFNLLIILCFGYYLGATAFRNVLLDTTVLAEYLDENDFYNRVYDDRILKDGLRDPTTRLTGGFDLSDDDRVLLLKEVIPPNYIHTEIDRNLVAIQRFLDGQTDELDVFLDLSQPVESVKPAVLALLDQKIGSGPTTSAVSSEELAEQIETFLTAIAGGRIPSRIPSSDTLGAASLLRAYEQALDGLVQQPSFPQEALSNLESRKTDIIDALGEDDARASLKLASRSVAEPRIDESIAELREILDERDRFDFLAHIAKEQNQTRAELLDRLRVLRIVVDVAVSVVPLLALALMALFVVSSGFVFFPRLRHMIFWPSASLLITGLLFLITCWGLSIDIPGGFYEECDGLTSTSCALTLGLIKSVTSDIVSVFILPSAIVAIIGAVGILLSFLLSLPGMFRPDAPSEVGR